MICVYGQAGILFSHRCLCKQFGKCILFASLGKSGCILFAFLAYVYIQADLHCLLIVACVDSRVEVYSMLI